MDVEATNHVGSGFLKQRKEHKIIGFSLSVIGLFWLARKAGWVSHDMDWVPHHASGSTIFWPLVLIALGVFLIFGLGDGGKKHLK